MKSASEIAMDSWRRTCGLPPVKPAPLMTLDEIRRTQCHIAFAELMHNRMIMGYFRYGDKRTFVFKPGYCLEFIRTRLQAYEE